MHCRRLERGPPALMKSRNESSSRPSTQHKHLLHTVMFGTASSYGKPVGTELRQLEGMPSLRIDNLRLNGGTVEMDANRQAVLGALFVDRTGRSLPALWEAMCGGAPRIKLREVAEKLAVQGAGILGPREQGLLQRHLVPAADGTVGRDEWLATFGPYADLEAGAPASRPEPVASAAGQATPQLMSFGELPHIRHDYGLPNAQHDPPTGYKTAVGVNWPGGHHMDELKAEKEKRLSTPRKSLPESAHTNAPYGLSTPRDMKGRPTGAPDEVLLTSPNYALTTADPPYATRFGTSELDDKQAHTPPLKQPSFGSTQQPELTTPYAVESDKDHPPDRRLHDVVAFAAWEPGSGSRETRGPGAPLERAGLPDQYAISRRVVEAPFASGGLWDRKR